ncbi:MAG: ADP-forming succinate--CoA ligase subunit beta [Candidatus Methanofastidiosia archaeon]
MKLYEYEAKKIFEMEGIPVPKGEKIEDADPDAFNRYEKIVLKSQVLSGGRGKAGGIKFPETVAEFQKNVNELLGSKIKDFEVKSLLVEEKLDIDQELYCGITISRADGKVVVMVSSEGGVDIEQVAKESPGKIISEKIDIRKGLPIHKVIDMARKIGIREKKELEVANILVKLYSIFRKYDAETAEINPLVITKDDRIVAADAKLDIYDEALFRHPEFKREDEFFTELEREARRYGLGYVEMDGNIGVIGNGAGLNIATLDILRFYGGNPANFLEVSGRTYMLAGKALEIVLKNAKVKIVMGNFFGSISRCDVIAQGITNAIKEGKVTVPLIVAMRGNGAEEGRKILKKAGIEVYEDDKVAAKKVIGILGHAEGN